MKQLDLKVNKFVKDYVVELTRCSFSTRSLQVASPIRSFFQMMKQILSPRKLTQRQGE